MTARLKKFSCVLVLAISLASCKSKEQTESIESSIPAPARTAIVEREGRGLELAGTTRAADVAKIASRFSGFVSRVSVHAGDHVKKGQVLVMLDDSNLSAQRERVNAGKDEARQAVEAANAQRRLAANTFERIKTLYDKKSASKQEYEEAESRKDAAEANYQGALKRVAQAESEIRDVRASSEYLRMTAPFDGIVTNVFVDEGTFVNPGQPIVSMENPGSFQVLFSVEEDLLNALQKNQELQVVIPVTGTEPLTATVDEISNVIDSSTRTFQVKANLPGRPQLRSGLSARIFLTASDGGSLWIPVEFLTRSNDVETVLVKERDQWKRVLVKSGEQKNGKVEVLTGLTEGEQIGMPEEQR